MHLEPAETDINLPLRHANKPSGARLDLPETSREGLPAAFKMRRERHYVEQLMGEAPLRTVREIPVADIDQPPGSADGALGQLEQSIREIGILQPLLVAQQGSRFAIISGANRYRAAREVGLRTVPCLVCETGTHTVDDLREAATRRAAAAAADEAAATDHGPLDAEREPVEPPPAAGLREVTGRLAFVSAVMPSLDVAGYDPLRWNTLTDLMKSEMERARSTAAAIEWLSAETIESRREPLDAADALAAVLEAIAPEARLQGVSVHVSSNTRRYELPANRAQLVRALTGLLQAMLSLSRRGGALQVECDGTSVRPALIVSVTQKDSAVDDGAVERFFDAEFRQHPAGPTSALVLAGVARVARLHGGRVQARALDGGGCAVTFVIPRPIAAA